MKIATVIALQPCPISGFRGDLFLDSVAIPRFQLLSISGDSSFEFNINLSSNVL